MCATFLIIKLVFYMDYINNTEFAEDMADDHWLPLTQEF